MPDLFVAVAELVPRRGASDLAAGRHALGTALELAADSRIAAISITDSAGGHPALSPRALAPEFLRHGREVIVHVACRDRSRNALLSLGRELASLGVRNVLAPSGDYPVEGYGGLSRPVFDVDSVGLLAMYEGLNRELAAQAHGDVGEPEVRRGSASGDGPDGQAAPCVPLFLGSVVNPHKCREAELIPLLAASPVDAVAAARADAPEHLRVEVDELARPRALVAHDRRSGLEAIEPVEAVAAQQAVDGRTGEAALPGEHVGPDAQCTPARTQRAHALGRVLARLAVDRAAPVVEAALALAPVAPAPLRRALPADAGRGRGARDRPAAGHPLDQEAPTARGEARIRMGHEGSFFDCGFDTDSRTIGALSPSTT